LNSQILTYGIDSHKRSVLNRIRSAVDGIDSGVVSFHFGGRPVRAQRSDIVRVISQMKFKSQAELGLRNIVLEAVMTSEYLSPGSGFLSLKLLLEKDQPDIEKFFGRVDKNTSMNSLRKAVGEGLSSKILGTILEKSSIESEIKIATSEMAFNPVIRSSPSLRIPGYLSEMFSTKKNIISDAGVLFFDGIIESVSEIDSLLQSLTKSKKNFVIFARGFTPEFSNTLSKNHSEGRLFVFPIVLPGKESAFEKFSDHSGFFDVENYYMTRTLEDSSFDFCHNVSIHDGEVSITGLDSFQRRISITLPSHLKNVLGIIEDRIKFGIIQSKEMAFFGACEIKGLGIFSKKCIETAKKTRSSLEKNLKNTVCLVLQER